MTNATESPGFTIALGAIHTVSEASSLYVNEVFSCPEFQMPVNTGIKVLDVGRAYPQGWPHRFGDVFKPHVHSADLNNRRVVSEFPKGTRAMPTGNTPTTPTPGKSTTTKARISKAKPATGAAQQLTAYKASTKATKPATGRILTPDIQRIREALELAIWHLDNDQILHATGWSGSASRRLQRLCEEQTQGEKS